MQRVVDRTPAFTPLARPKTCPGSALRQDCTGATFTHSGDEVTFEVVAESFGLLDAPALRHMAAWVRCSDIGGIPVDAAPGRESMARGLQARRADARAAAAIATFDAADAAMRVPDEH